MQLVNTMFISNNRNRFTCGEKESLAKHRKVSKCYETDYRCRNEHKYSKYKKHLTVKTCICCWNLHGAFNNRIITQRLRLIIMCFTFIGSWWSKILKGITPSLQFNNSDPAFYKFFCITDLFAGTISCIGVLF